MRQEAGGVSTAGEGPAGGAIERVRARAAAGSGRDRLDALLGNVHCVVLRAGELGEAARRLAALLGEGKRVIVAGPSTGGWVGELREKMPSGMRGLCLPGPPPLSAAELTELRMLLLSDSAARRARVEQALPDSDWLPDPQRVARLCDAAAGGPDPAPHGAKLIPDLLIELELTELAQLSSAAARVRDALRALNSVGVPQWSRPLLERVVYGAARADFETLREHAAQVAIAADELAGPDYLMTLIGPPPPDGVQRLGEYIAFLESGGRPRRWSPSPAQQAAVGVLTQLGMAPPSRHEIGHLRQALRFLRLHQEIERFSSLCAELAVPVPRPTPAAVARRARELALVGQAATAIEALRRKVLFLRPSWPIPMGNLDVIAAVAGTIASRADRIPSVRAELAAVADALAATVPEEGPTPEVAEVLRALRAGNHADYQRAVAALAVAASERAEALRQIALLDRMREGAPELAAAWTEPGTHRYTQGIAQLLAVDELVAAAPGPDSGDDVLMLLDADTLELAS
jgi:hypothetical protein